MRIPTGREANSGTNGPFLDGLWKGVGWTRPMESVGVDACRQGWVAVRLDQGRFQDARLYPDLAGLLDEAGEVVAVDIPLGLTEQDERECDRLGKKLLGPLSRTLFPIPPRSVVEIEDYVWANDRCGQVTGKGLSWQTHGLFAKIREADRLRASGEHRLHEVHPELPFRAMVGEPLGASKKTWNGQAERRRALAQVGIVLPEDLGEAGRAPVDDVIDAAAAAWSAHRIAREEAVRCPETPQLDTQGKSIQIWR